MSPRSIFVSYCHLDEQWLNGLMPHLRALELAEEVTVWTDREINAGERWYSTIAQALRGADIGICLVTANFLASAFCVKEEIPALIERRERSGMQLIFVLAEPCPWQQVSWIAETAVLPSGGRNILEHFAGSEAVAYNEVAQAILHGKVTPSKPLGLEFADLERLPPTGAELFGRGEILAELDRAWASEDVRVVSLVAQGGTGKTTILNKWSQATIQHRYQGVRRAFAWSFYRPGLGDTSGSADAFIAEALQRFGDQSPEIGSPWDRGARLAKLVAATPSLIVLDGMEPLQSSFATDRGKVLDPALSTFLSQLARTRGRGLCVISTRVPVRDFEEYAEASTLELGLEQMSAQAGRALLRIGRVLGSDTALEEASRACGNHALALRLLSGHLAGQPDNHIDAAAPLLCGSSPPVERIIAELERSFGEGPELQVMRLLGLFDRPAERAAVDALRNAAIPLLSDALSGERYVQATDRLRELSVIEVRGQDRSVDCHPLIRDYFARRLSQRAPAAWVSGNACLYQHYRNLAQPRPDTLRGLMPLYRAVAHACACGHAQEAFDELYWQRISRGAEFYSTRKLGAYGADLACLAAFFVERWSTPSAELRAEDRAHVLTLVSTRLRALGRTDMAEDPIRTAVDLYVAQQDWRNATNSLRNLGELLLDRGWIRESIAAAQQSISYAHDADAGQLIASLSSLAHARHQTGEHEQAAEHFEEARAIQAHAEPHRPLLHGQPGFQYCAWLLDQGLAAEAKAHADQTLAWAHDDDRPLDIGRDHVTLGSAHLALGETQQARQHLAEAEPILRQAGALNFVVYAPLARAELHIASEDFATARAELDDALALASNMGVRLREADARLAMARVLLALDEREHALREQRRAEAIIRWAGYGRRSAAAAAFRAAIDRRGQA
ncbi:MAG TPA: TIR domain-containing protein [Polyangiaceae bacterium]|nr:TIR domain-containing protein [Polyangiaceae bacterium]